MKISVPRFGTVVKIFLGSVAVIYLLTVIYGLNMILSLYSSSASHPIHPSLAQLSEGTGLSFPANARLVAFEFESAIDTSVFATLDMSSEDLAAFLAANKIDPSDLKKEGIPMSDIRSWTPSRSKDLVSTGMWLGPGRALYIGVSNAGDRATVYINWFTT